MQSRIRQTRAGGPVPKLLFGLDILLLEKKSTVI